MADEVGHPVDIRVLRLVLKGFGLVSPMMRGLAEMAYQFREQFVLDTSKFDAAFSITTTPLATAVADTIAWYRTRERTP